MNRNETKRNEIDRPEDHTHSERAEQLSKALGEIDGALLREALEADSAEALARLSQNGKHTERSIPRRSSLRRVLPALSAAVALLLAVAILLPRLLTRPTDGRLPWDASVTLTGGIDSLDALNYCAARLALSGEALPQSSAITAQAQKIGLLPLSSFTETAPTTESAMAPEHTEPPEDTASDRTAETEEIVIYYELSPDMVYRVTQTVYFQIDLKSEHGFLAALLGTGITDVVITENSLEEMITFKNGDRYYSCLLNAATETMRSFSTHKYIDGFAIVKNLSVTNFAFDITFRGDTVTGFSCRYFESADSGELRIPDIASVVDGSTYISEREVSSTLRELEAYLSDVADGSTTEQETGRETEPEAPIATVYSGSGYTFTFRADGSFTYTLLEGATETLLKMGTYSRIENDSYSGYFLHFTRLDGSTLATDFVPFTDTETFEYDGTRFHRARVCN